VSFLTYKKTTVKITDVRIQHDVRGKIEEPGYPMMSPPFWKSSAHCCISVCNICYCIGRKRNWKL